MSISARTVKYILHFKNPSGTSRGILKTKETWFLMLQENDKIGIGETGLFRGLSYDDVSNYSEKIAWTCQNIHLGLDVLLEELTHF
ncbi:MAG: o-succinylbenzoate synthase, partial [Polaribacter sp.]|nr:o-succinylbenzoate synthase [Polaribacter sp.]